MCKKRLFVAINLPKKIKDNLSSYSKNYPEIPARWTKKENLHITLFFIGSASFLDEKRLIERVKKISEKNKPFEISLSKIDYDSVNKKNPKMIWCFTEPSEKINNIRKEIEISSVKKPNNFIPHITMARINEWKFKKINPEEMVTIDKDIFLSFYVNTIEIMESKFKRGFSEHTVLKSFSLGY